MIMLQVKYLNQMQKNKGVCVMEYKEFYIADILDNAETVLTDITYSDTVTIMTGHECDDVLRYRHGDKKVYFNTRYFKNNDMEDAVMMLQRYWQNYLLINMESIRRIYRALVAEKYNPLFNVEEHSHESTRHSGEEYNTTNSQHKIENELIYSGTETESFSGNGTKNDTNTKTGSNSSTNTRTGQLTESTTNGGDETDTKKVFAYNVTDTGADDEKNIHTVNTVSTKTSVYDNLKDVNTTSYDNLTDTGVSSYNDTNTNERSFTDRKDSTNLNETTTDTHRKYYEDYGYDIIREREGNIGITSSMELATQECKMRDKYKVVLFIIDGFIDFLPISF